MNSGRQWGPQTSWPEAVGIWAIACLRELWLSAPQPRISLLLLDGKEDTITLVMGMAGPVRLEDNDLARARGRAQETGSGLWLPGRK